MVDIFELGSVLDRINLKSQLREDGMSLAYSRDVSRRFSLVCVMVWPATGTLEEGVQKSFFNKNFANRYMLKMSENVLGIEQSIESFAKQSCLKFSFTNKPHSTAYRLKIQPDSSKKLIR